MISVGPRSADDLSDIRALLEGSGLPTSDLETARPTFAVLRDGNTLIAAGALQAFGAAALLRSVAVAPDRRGTGLGQRVVRELERLARPAGIEYLVLLTLTASEFFARLGYRVIDREAAPKDMQQSEEFRSLCPSSATCMAKHLADST